MGNTKDEIWDSSWPWYSPVILSLVIIFVIGALAGLSLWQATVEKENALSRDLRNSVMDIEFRINGVKDFLQLLAEEVKEGRLGKGLFEKRSAQFLDNHPELAYISFTSSNEVVQWVAPGDSIPLESTQVSFEESKKALYEAIQTQQMVFSNAFISAQGSVAVNLFIPVYMSKGYGGALTAQFVLSDLLEMAIKTSVAEKYVVSLSQEDDNPLATLSEDDEPDHSLSGLGEINLLGKKLLLRLTGYQSPWNWIYITLALVCVGLSVGLGFSLWILARDMHRRKLIQDQLQKAMEHAEAANRAKSELIANISHELRTPLGAIHGFTELLSDPNQGPAARHKGVLAIRRNCRNLLELVNDLLDMSKIEAGLLDIEKVSFSLPQEIAELVTLFRSEAVARGLRLKVVYDGPIPDKVLSDPRRVRQILTNLIGNALKFTEKGEVVLAIRLQELPDGSHALQFFIKDSGIGIDPKQAKKLFTPFVQGDSSISRRFGGSGLGLALSRRLAHLLDGEVELIESQPGKGSLFRLAINPGPLQDARLLVGLVHAEPEDMDESRLNGNELAGVKVLIVEDCDDNQVIYASFLKSAGAQVLVASNGNEGLQKLNEQYVDLVLMDIQMPGLDGYATTKKLREQGYKTPVVAITAHAMRGERERCLSVGCDEYLTKPVEGDTLVKTVAFFVETRRQITEKNPLGPGPGPGPGDPLFSLYRDDPRVMPVLQSFVLGVEERLHEMRDEVARANWKQVYKLAHRLKGTAGNYGYPDLARLASLVETEASTTSNQERLSDYLNSLDSMKVRMVRGLDI